MAGLVGLHDAQGAVVWINPSWVKAVRDAGDGGSVIEFMDGERLSMALSGRAVIKRLNASLAPQPAAPAESPNLEKPKAETPEAQAPQSGGGVRNLLRKVALEA